MEELEWRTLVGTINKDIAGIVHAQRVLEEVNDELHNRTTRPIEEDYIFADGFGRSPGAPHVILIDGVEISTRMLHRRGLGQKDIKGADLLYEIAGRKFVLVQYKVPDARYRVTNDRSQLCELMASCPNPCPPHSPGFWPTCGAWYAVHSQDKSAYLPACEAQRVFGDNQSRLFSTFGTGMEQHVFQQLFARCWTGARVSPSEFAYLSWAELEADRVLFTSFQRGSFGRW